MMKFMPFLFLLTSSQLFSQSHVEWDATVDDCNVLVVSAEIDEGWHIYSQFQNEDAGPIPTEITVELDDREINIAAEPVCTVKYDENYGGEVRYFEGEVIFRVALPDDVEGDFNVRVVFMTCNEEGCLPPEMKEFKLSI